MSNELRARIEEYIDAMAADGNADFSGWDIVDDLRMILDRLDGRPTPSQADNPWGGKNINERTGAERIDGVTTTP